MHFLFIPGVLVLDSFRRIRSFSMSEHGECAVFRVMSGELRRSCFCFNRDRSFKFGSDTKVHSVKNRSCLFATAASPTALQYTQNTLHHLKLT